MSIATRPNRGDLATGSGNGSGYPNGISRPPTELLPDGGNLAPAPAPAPERELARDALRLIRLLRSDGSVPSPRLRDAMSSDVESVRRQLDPIRTRRSLAASYSREAFHEGLALSPGSTALAGAARIAYVIRWLELGAKRT